MRRKARRGGGRQLELTVGTIGGRGDGVGLFEGRPVFVAGTLPGERVRLRLVGERAGGYVGELLELQEPSAERQEPPCRHFGPCGGCSLQHWSSEAYGAWKQALVETALKRRGVAAGEIRPLIRVGPASRRRAGLAAIKADAGLQLGFHERAGPKVVDGPDCQILTPLLQQAAADLRQFLPEAMTPGESLGLTLSESDAGLDLLVTATREATLADREAWAEQAATADWARVCWQAPDQEPEPLCERRRPTVTFGEVPVAVPPGAFIQPTRAGEAALVKAVQEALPETTQSLADLYAGLGTFSFAVVERARVHAVEGEAGALAALLAAARRNELAAWITAEDRDLARNPLSGEELAPFDAVVFDPPRAGARSQAEEIARSKVPLAVGISCNPNTFSRDAKILLEGGYRLNWVQPIDQFHWSGHVELAAVFRR